LMGGSHSVKDGKHDEMADRAQEVVKEVCNTILYAVLLAASVGVDGEQLEEQLCDVFNRKSEEYGFPERLGF
jgi:hypothetical protein